MKYGFVVNSELLFVVKHVKCRELMLVINNELFMVFAVNLQHDGRYIILRSSFSGTSVWSWRSICSSSGRHIVTDNSSNIFSITIVNTDVQWVNTLNQF